MPGTIRKRDDRGTDAWEIRVFIGRDASGRPKQRSVLFRGGKRQAERELARLVSEQEATPAIIMVDESRQWGVATTVNDAITGWKNNGWNDLSPNTTRRYEEMWRLYVKESIGAQKIMSIGPYDVERYFRRLKDDGLSKSNVRQIRAFLHRACRLARRWSGNVLINPLSDTELPEWGIAGQTRHVRAPSLDEVKKILRAAAAEDSRLAAFVRVVAATGARRGEVCALRWNDIDLEKGVLTIDEGVITGTGGATVRSTKTRASIRSLAVDGRTLKALEALEREQSKLAELCEMALKDDSFVFSFEPGGTLPPYPDVFSRAFARIRKAAGVASDVHLHSLRHFQSTVLDPIIPERQKQARMGWSTVHMARHYTDPIEEEDRRAAKHVGKLLDSKGSSKGGSKGG